MKKAFLALAIVFLVLSGSACATAQGDHGFAVPSEPPPPPTEMVAPSPSSAAGEAVAQYDQARALAQEAMQAKFESERKRLESAQAYETAIAILKDVKINFPDWKSEAIAQKLKECEEALAAVKAPLVAPPAFPGPVPPAPAAVVAPPAVAPAAAAVSTAPPTAPFVGHGVSKKVHRSSCEWAQKIGEANRVYFNTYEEAAAAGFAACKVCKPDLGGSGAAVSAPAALSPGEGPSTAPFIGHKGSKKVHRSDCQYGQKMSPSNRVYFNTYQEAVAAGYAPCGTCKPDQSSAAAMSGPAAPAPAAGSDTGVSAPAAPPGAPENEYWTSGKGKTFHRPSCDWAKKISADNLVKYKTREEATAAGKSPCRVCNP